MSIWRDEKTWRELRNSYSHMLKLGLRTQFVQSAYSECYIAWALDRAGYEVKFHPEGHECDILFRNNGVEKKLEVKHSQVNKEPWTHDENRQPYPNGEKHGFESWVIPEKQVDNEKFDYLVLVKDTLATDEPSHLFVFKRCEIVDIKKVEVNGRDCYYIWDSKYFQEYKERSSWMRGAANHLVEKLHSKPETYVKRWKNILSQKEIDA